MKYFENFSAKISGLKYFFDRNPSVFPPAAQTRTTKSRSFAARIFDRFPPKAIEKASRNVRENAWIPIEEIYQSKNFSAVNFEIFHL